MPNYRRLRRCGGTYFLTVVTYRRRRILVDPIARRCLHHAIERIREHWPFTILELVLLPDHFHIILTLPEGVDDFSIRIGRIKSKFTELYLAAGGEEVVQSASREAHGLRGIWQKRFWEHLVRDDNDLGECRKYCWYNPTKHGLAKCPHDWHWSTFHRAVESGWIDNTWCCSCGADSFRPPPAIPGAEMD